MSRNRQDRRPRPLPASFVSCLRHFLTPALWKQAHQTHQAIPHRPQRWNLQPLLMVLLLMTWCTGDSQPERFETARAFYITLAPKRRRPGKTIQGFHHALARLPLSVLRAFALALRQHLRLLLEDTLPVDGFIPLGVDGSRLRCPRTAELGRVW